MRSDARRNRDQILRSARALFLSRGPHVPMEEIANDAGVGVGTLYRRFPDRYSLLKAVAIQNMGWVVEEAEAALAKEADGWHALARLIRRIFERRLGDPIPRVLPVLIERAQADASFHTARRRAAERVAEVLEWAKHEGAIRADLAVADILVLPTARAEPSAVLGEERADAMAERHLRILLDGLRPHPDTRLPVGAADTDLETFFSDTNGVQPTDQPTDQLGPDDSSGMGDEAEHLRNR